MQRIVKSGDIYLNARSDGPEDGRVVMFGNSLGTDLRVWDALLPHLPDGLRFVRFDKRGHGLSDAPDAPYAMDALVGDALAVMDAFELSDVTFVGLSIGGLIAQGLAATAPDRLRAVVLMDTAAKIGTEEMWRERMEMVDRLGLAAIADGVLERWFAPAFCADPAKLTPWRNMLSRTPKHGYLGCCAAIAASDFTQSTAGLRLPVMAMAGEYDGSTPPEVVKATAALCGAAFHELADAGHIPCVEQPAEVGRLITEFLKET